MPPHACIAHYPFPFRICRRTGRAGLWREMSDCGLPGSHREGVKPQHQRTPGAFRLGEVLSGLTEEEEQRKKIAEERILANKLKVEKEKLAELEAKSKRRSELRAVAEANRARCAAVVRAPSGANYNLMANAFQPGQSAHELAAAAEPAGKRAAAKAPAVRAQTFAPDEDAPDDEAKRFLYQRRKSPNPDGGADHGAPLYPCQTKVYKRPASFKEDERITELREKADEARKAKAASKAKVVSRLPACPAHYWAMDTTRRAAAQLALLLPPLLPNVPRALFRPLRPHVQEAAERRRVEAVDEERRLRLLHRKKAEVPPSMPPSLEYTHTSVLCFCPSHLCCHDLSPRANTASTLLPFANLPCPERVN